MKTRRKISPALAGLPLLAACATTPAAAPVPPRAAPLVDFRAKVPLTAEELQKIANNRTRFARLPSDA